MEMALMMRGRRSCIRIVYSTEVGSESISESCQREMGCVPICSDRVATMRSSNTIRGSVQ